MITVETTDATVRVTIPKSEVPTARLNWFVDSLRLEAIASKSQLSEDEASHPDRRNQGGLVGRQPTSFHPIGGMNADRVVVDANIAFKALVSQRGDLRDVWIR